MHGRAIAEAALALQQQRVVVVTETAGPSKPKMALYGKSVPTLPWKTSHRSNSSVPGCMLSQPAPVLYLLPHLIPLPTLRGRGLNVPILHMRKLRLILLLITNQVVEPALNPSVLIPKPHLNPDF